MSEAGGEAAGAGEAPRPRAASPAQASEPAALGDPFVRCYPRALSPALCQEIVREFRASPEVRRGQVGGGVDPRKKDSWDLTISAQPEWAARCEQVRAAAQACLADYARAFPALLTGSVATAIAREGAPRSLTPENFAAEGAARSEELLARLYRLGHLNLQRYLRGVGGYPHWHSEVYPRERDAEPLHRVLFWLVYLNDVEQGGETEFLHQGLAVAPREGTLLVAPAGFTHTHRGNPPRSGDKFVLTSWLLFRRAEELY